MGRGVHHQIRKPLVPVHALQGGGNEEQLKILWGVIGGVFGLEIPWAVEA